MKTITSAIAIGLVAFVSLTRAAAPPASLTMIPPQINYQGRLVTPANAPYNDATHTIDLSLYPSASGGAKLWSERYTVQTRDGYFSVNLGSGGTPLLSSNNLPIWQVLWKSDPASPDTFFMALTLRTDQNGSAIANPVEATPRQQFLTAPFAYRAHQSVYATRADGLFSAPQGVQTPTLSSTNNEVAVNANTRVGAANWLYANNVTAHGASPHLYLLSGGGPLRLGVNYTSLGGIGGGLQYVSEYASSIQIGAQSGGLLNDGSGTDLRLDGRTVDIGTTNLTINNKPMFVRKSVTLAVNTATILTSVSHGISTTDYDVTLVGWYYSNTTPAIRGVLLNPGATAATVYFTAPPAGGSVILQFLGIRKILSDNL